MAAKGLDEDLRSLAPAFVRPRLRHVTDLSGVPARPSVTVGKLHRNVRFIATASPKPATSSVRSGMARSQAHHAPDGAWLDLEGWPVL